ncbi:MAG: DUF1648 domain-containing protein [Betaproteobacteria bacterium]|nr:DUF1648 domain-containing protein [Betaproteobacteria bacterium]
MSRFAISVFALLAAVLIADITATFEALPEPVATHFDGAGRPDDWMSRRGYAMFIFAFGIGLPLAIVGLMRFVAWRFPARLNIPNRRYWLAPERRESTLRFLVSHMWRLACLMVLFAFAIHRLLVAANLARPVELPLVPFLVLLGLFLGGLAAWIAVLVNRFRKMP